MSSRSLCRARLGAVAFTALLAHAAAAEDVGPRGAAAPHVPARSDPAASERVAERARQLFDEGVKLANEQRFDSARAVFQSAYELQPHPSVLYNIAQCEVRLGELASAEATLQHFLDSSGSEIPEPQRQAVEQQLAELRAALPGKAGSPTAAVPRGGIPPVIAGGETPRLPPSNESTASGSVGIAAAPLAAPPLAAPPLAAPPNAAHSERPSSLRPILLGGTGLLLLGTATALYVWNDGRYDAWSDEQAELASIPGFRVQVARDPELWSRADASNQRLSSIHTVDAVSVVLATVGALALGAGAWDWFTPEGESTAGDATASRLPRAGSQLRLSAGATPLLRWHTYW